MGAAGPKQLFQFQGTSLLRHAALTAADSVYRPLIAVLGFESDRMQCELDGLPFETALNSNWSAGMGTSISAGIQTLTARYDELDSVVIMLCDQPFVTAQHLNKLGDASVDSALLIAASEYNGVVGVPALFKRPLFSELANLRQDQGARSIIEKHKPDIITLPCHAGSIDIDTQDQYRAIAG